MLSTEAAITAGIVLLAVVTIAYGGTFLLRVVSGAQPANDLQKTYFRAGHAHAGVLVILGLVVLLLVEAADVPAWGHAAADGVLFSAIVIPAGFFFSVIGHDPQRTNRWRVLLGAGFVLLTVSLLVGGVALIVTGSAG